MVSEGQSAYCWQCGESVQGEDKFCGSCGARVAPVTPEDPQVIPRPVAASQGATARSSRRPFFLAAVVVVLAMLVVGGGALAFAGFGPGNGLLGGSEQESRPGDDQEAVAPSQPENSQEPTEYATTESTESTTPSAQPDSDIVQLEEFGREYDAAARRGDWAATYAMLDETSQQEFTEAEWAEKQQALRDASGPFASLESVSVQPNEEMSDAPATVTLSYEDGTEETMMAMAPMVVGSGDDPGPKRYLTGEEISELEQLSASSSASSNTSSPGPSTAELEADAEEAAGDYYRAAGVEDWDYTYENLDSSAQSQFTREEWFQKNQWFADNGSVIYDIVSVVRQGGTRGPIVEVSLRLTYEDGSSSTRTTYFLYEDGSWKHGFGEEESDLFMPDTSYEEFVEAQGG